MKTASKCTRTYDYGHITSLYILPILLQLSGQLHQAKTCSARNVIASRSCKEQSDGAVSEATQPHPNPATVVWAGFPEFRLANPSHEFKDDAAGPTTFQVGKVTRVRE